MLLIYDLIAIIASTVNWYLRGRKRINATVNSGRHSTKRVPLYNDTRLCHRLYRCFRFPACLRMDTDPTLQLQWSTGVRHSQFQHPALPSAQHHRFNYASRWGADRPPSWGRAGRNRGMEWEVKLIIFFFVLGTAHFIFHCLHRRRPMHEPDIESSTEDEHWLHLRLWKTGRPDVRAGQANGSTHQSTAYDSWHHRMRGRRIQPSHQLLRRGSFFAPAISTQST